MIKELLQVRSLNDLSAIQVTIPNWQDILGRFRDVLANPSADPAATGLSLLFVLNILAIIFVLVLWFILKTRENRQINQEIDELERFIMERYPEEQESLRESRISTRYYMLAATALTLIGLFAFASFGSQQNFVCVSCHQGDTHFELKAGTPHAKTLCVSCHESASFVTRTATSFIPRVNHIFKNSNFSNAPKSDSLVQNNGFGNQEKLENIYSTLSADTSVRDYGQVGSAQCFACHKKEVLNISTHEATGVRMRHKDPLEAGTRCLDCHAKHDAHGTIYMNKGMTECLNCHNDEVASTKCDTCHTKDYAAASASRVMMGEAQPLITPPYDCYTCHQPKSCDDCHKIRIPHTYEFMTTKMHGYEGAKSLWAGSKGICLPCHNSERRSCNGKCHGGMPYHFRQVPSFPQTHADGMWGTQSGSAMACGDCHKPFTDDGKLNTCEGCHRYKGAK